MSSDTDPSQHLPLGEVFGGILLQKTTIEKAGSIPEAIAQSIIPTLLEKGKLELLPTVIKDYLAKVPQDKERLLTLVQKKLMEMFSSLCEEAARNGEPAKEKLQPIVDTVLAIVEDKNQAQEQLRSIASQFSVPHSSENGAQSSAISKVTQEPPPSASEEYVEFPGIGLLWEPYNSKVRKGSPNFSNETPTEKRVREPFRHLTQYVMPEKGHLSFVHRTTIGNATKIVSGGFDTGGDFSLQSTTTTVRSNYSEGAALDDLLTRHYAADSAIIIDVPEDKVDEITRDVDIFTEEGVVDPKYIKGYVDFKTKLFIPNPAFQKG